MCSRLRIQETLLTVAGLLVVILYLIVMLSMVIQIIYCTFIDQCRTYFIVLLAIGDFQGFCSRALAYKSVVPIRKTLTKYSVQIYFSQISYAHCIYYFIHRKKQTQTENIGKKKRARKGVIYLYLTTKYLFNKKTENKREKIQPSFLHLMIQYFIN